MEGQRKSHRAKLKPDMVWLMCDPRGEWRNVVVVVKVISTDKMNGSLMEKDDKY